MVPVDGVGPVIPHSRKKHPPCLSLLKDVPDGPPCPVAISSELKRVLSNREGIGRTECHTAVAAYTHFFFGTDFIAFRIVGVAFKGTLPNAHLALNASVRISLDLKFGFEMAQIHFDVPPLTIP